MKLKVLYPDSTQRFNMGGPYIGPLELNGERLDGEFLDENFVCDKEFNWYGFVRFKWRREKLKIFFGIIPWTALFRECKILVHDTQTGDWYLSKSNWESLFVTKLSAGCIHYTEAFHNGSPERFELKINEANFERITESEKKLHTTPAIK